MKVLVCNDNFNELNETKISPMVCKVVTQQVLFNFSPLNQSDPF